MSRIPASPEFDPRIADWLEADPDHAPPEVLATVQAAYPSIPQRRASRVPGRFQPMNRLTLFGAAAAIVVVAGLGGLMLANRSGTPAIGGNPTPNPTPLATPNPTPSAVPSPTDTPEASRAASGVQGFTEAYASDLYAYGLRYPATWNMTPGALAGRSDYIPDLAEGRTDFYGDTMSGHGLMITSAPVSTERTDLAAWSAFIADEVVRLFDGYLNLPACEQSTRALTVDGEPANERDFICPDHDWLWVTTVHGGRAYQIAWLDDGGFDSDYLRPFLDRFLQTFTFSD